MGYLEPEFRALGAPFEQRGAVADEYLAAMQAIWSQAKPAYQGRFVSFADIRRIRSRCSARTRRS